MRLEIARRADLALRTMRFLGEASTRVKAQAIADALRSTQPCVLHEAWTRARSELVTTLGAMPLSSLALVTPTRA